MPFRTLNDRAIVPITLIAALPELPTKVILKNKEFKAQARLGRQANGQQIANVLSRDTANPRHPLSNLWLLAPQHQPAVHDFGPDL
jgi:hypothetical protein